MRNIPKQYLNVNWTTYIIIVIIIIIILTTFITDLDIIILISARINDMILIIFEIINMMIDRHKTNRQVDEPPLYVNSNT